MRRHCFIASCLRAAAANTTGLETTYHLLLSTLLVELIIEK